MIADAMGRDVGVADEGRRRPQLGADGGRQWLGQYGVALFVTQVALERLEQAGRFADADHQIGRRDGAAVEERARGRHVVHRPRERQGHEVDLELGRQRRDGGFDRRKPGAIGALVPFQLQRPGIGAAMEKALSTTGQE